MKASRMSIGFTICFCLLNLGVTPSESAAKLKTKSIKVVLPGGGSITLKGTKPVLFKTLQQEMTKRNNLDSEFENCSDEECISLEDDLLDSYAVIETLTRSLYTKAADASMLTPLTKAEFKLFSEEIKWQMTLVQRDLDELMNSRNAVLNSYLNSFDSSYLKKGNYTRDTCLEVFKLGLTDQWRTYNKILPYFEKMSQRNNTEKVTEINISKRRSLEEIIISEEEQMRINLGL